MNKTPSVFLRNPENMDVMTREVNPRCQWVLDGEGVATRMYDGTCVMLDENGKWWARREVKKGKTTPPNWKPVEHDDVTGKLMGWEPIEQSGYRKMLLEALEEWDLDANLPMHREPGTYELCGPKINGNPEKFGRHTLVKHSEAQRFTWIDEEGKVRNIIGRNTYSIIKSNILAVHQTLGWEGLVWHHPDGRMAKMKASDYKREVTH